MARGILIVLDSVGCGGAPDADAFGDEGANTLGHIIQECAAGRAEEGRSGPLNVPNMEAMGLGAAIRAASDIDLPGFEGEPNGIWGAAVERSRGKDTPSGHWELSGLPVPWDWHYFPEGDPSIPGTVTDPIIQKAGIPGTLCNGHSSGMPVLDKYGEEHIRTGKPIFYTSADSVLQIAAHEEVFGLERLLDLCRTAAEVVHPMRVGRVIARPFVGQTSGNFTRTANRKDFAIEPPGDTLLDRVVASGARTHAVGKITDIFSGRGVSRKYKGRNDSENVDALLNALDEAGDGDFIFVNLVDFDTLYGHQRDVSGYAANLEAFDRRLPEIFVKLRQGDLLFITADHGNDPTWTGTDHTREQVPVLGTGPGIAAQPTGAITFADVGETVAAHLGLAPGEHGRSFL
ncbi:phosphopentomutase [Amaricoccus tamworthensis]|uniref:phosphopentomutase n=1 Tax=Amaricoccus tamworthensis TaxID=57002 RepID=UPI003C7A36BF